MNDYEALIKKRGYVINKQQERFCDNLQEFINNPNHVGVFRGGMGLGKTFATALIISKYLHKYDRVVIVTPYTNIKVQWCKELNYHQPKDYVEWVSKRDCLIPQYHTEKDIDNCTDDCEHRNHLEKNGRYTSLCYQLLNQLTFPINTLEYYEKYPNDCLYSLINLGLLTKKIVIADYFAFLNNSISYYKIFKSRDDNISTSTKQKSLVIIDEAHLLEKRAKDYLTKSIQLPNKYNQEKIDIEILKLPTAHEQRIVMNALQRLKKIKNNIIKELEAKRVQEKKFDYQNFVDQFNNIIIKNDVIHYTFEEFKWIISKVKEKDYEDESSEDNYLYNLNKFLENLEYEYTNKNYNITISKKELKQDKIISLKIQNLYCGDYLTQLYYQWDKVILLSGTIKDEYLKNIGLEKENIYYPEDLNSYSLKKHVKIYSQGDFTNGLIGFDKVFEELQEIINILSGRTIIFCKNKKLCDLLESKLLEYSVFNFTNLRGTALEESIKEFNQKSNAIALFTLQGRVEGMNLLNEDGNPPKNLIVLGYPYQARTENYKATKELYNELYGIFLSQTYQEFIPITNTIHQACARVKRSSEDNPIIILWDKCFVNTRKEYQLLSNDLKGNMYYEFPLLKDEVMRHARRD